MHSKDDANEARAAAIRLRAAAPAAAFAFPAVALLVAGVLGVAWPEGAPVSWLVALAAPAVVPVVAAGNESPSVVPFVAAVVVSAPLWIGIGAVIGRRARGDWARYWQLYAIACAAWTAVATLALWLL